MTLMYPNFHFNYKFIHSFEKYNAVLSYLKKHTFRYPRLLISEVKRLKYP